MKRPGKSDPSRPREDGYDYKREFYRSSQVAEDYDFHRFSTPGAAEAQRAQMGRHLARRCAKRPACAPSSICPAAPGRFTGALAREGFEIVGSDISHRDAAQGCLRHRGRPGSRRSAATCRPTPKHLPLRNDSLDCVVSIRFMMHVDPGIARAHAARVPSRVAPLGHRRLPPLLHVPLRAHAHVRPARHRAARRCRACRARSSSRSSPTRASRSARSSASRRRCSRTSG